MLLSKVMDTFKLLAILFCMIQLEIHPLTQSCVHDTMKTKMILIKMMLIKTNTYLSELYLNIHINTDLLCI